MGGVGLTSVGDPLQGAPSLHRVGISARCCLQEFQRYFVGHSQNAALKQRQRGIWVDAKENETSLKRE